MLNIVILAGGSGTRLWPLSKKNNPKQFVRFKNNQHSLFQMTINRIKKLDPHNMIIVCNKDHFTIVQQQIEEVNDNINNINNKISKIKIITEPISRNTAPPIAVICNMFNVNDNINDNINNNSNNIILVIPSDHIFDDDLFIKTIKENIHLTNYGIVLFGIKPTYPEIGYGYIEFEDNNIIKFIEKPKYEKALEYTKDGKHLWNSGVFLFTQNIMSTEFKMYAPDIWEPINDYMKIKIDDGNTFDIMHLDNTLYENLRNISIDYAIMEHHKSGKIIKYNGKWNDIGSFKALHSICEKDKNGNVIDIIANGNIKIINTNNCYIKSDKKNIAVIGVDNLSIIEYQDCLLITNNDQCQSVKNVVVEFEKIQ